MLRHRPALRSALLLATLAACPMLPAQAARAQPTPAAAGPASETPDAASIVAIVNGDIISRGDVDNRRRLFALSSGLPTSRDVLDRLTPQVTQQLIDERLRLQEIQRRHILITDDEIAKSIGEVEQRNNMTQGTLQRRLAGDGVSLRTLVDQIRVQIGWGRVLHQVLGSQAQISDADVAERARVLKSEIGQPEYRVSEIFVPIENPTASEQAQKFSDTVIQQLRAGAPFSVAAAQFSQSQTALQGGDLGWVQPNEIDPQVLAILNQMPVGAVSNPVRVPGGISIVTLRAKRAVGLDVANVLSIRQAFLEFKSKLDPEHPTDQQKQALEQARKLSQTAKSCDDMEAADKQFGSGRPSDPGPVTMENLPPAMHAIMEKLVPGHASQPLVAQDGIAVLMVCSRDARTAGVPPRAEIADSILNDRVELASRQLLRDLTRKAVIERRGG